MKNNINSKYKKTAVLSGALTLALLTSACANHTEDVTVKMKEKKEDKDVKPTIEIEEVTWVQFDESALMYKVDLDKFLTDKLKLSKSVLENRDIINLIRYNS